MPPHALARRGFLTVAASLAACRLPTRARVDEPERTPEPHTHTPTPASESTLDRATIAAAERVAGVRYTDSERDAIAMVLGAHVERATRRRAHPLTEGVAPASRFDPRLPGRHYGPPTGRIDAHYEDAPAPRDELEIAFAPLRRLGGWLRHGRLTSTRITEIALARLREIGEPLACVARLTDALALEQARAADRSLREGRDRGPLHGIPWGAKDILDTAGIATTWGAEPFADRMPTTDATVVARMHEAGAVLCAKLTTGALAYGDIWDGGTTKNPWNTVEGASGSSAGPAAAVSGGLVAVALGSETLGSIVSPAMRCGTMGLRPTFGRVPRTGCMPLCWSLDKIGPLARTVEDTLWTLAAVGGVDRHDPSAIAAPLRYDAKADVRGLRIGHSKALLSEGKAGELERGALAALRSAGATLVEIELPSLPYDALLTILFAEAAAAFESMTLDDRDDALSWQGATAWPNTFRAARFITAVDLVAADRIRRLAMQAMEAVFDRVDAIVGASFADPMLLLTNMTGHPCLVVPIGLVERAPEPATDGTPATSTTSFAAPHGLTIWGRLFDEGTLAAIGRTLERSHGLGDRRPGAATRRAAPRP